MDGRRTLLSRFVLKTCIAILKRKRKFTQQQQLVNLHLWGCQKSTADHPDSFPTDGLKIFTWGLRWARPLFTAATRT
jgi:hypothetical protein